MYSDIIKYITVYLLSMTKFMAGPPIGMAVGISIIETILLSILGMMTSVLIFTWIGDRITSSWMPEVLKRMGTRKPTNRHFLNLWNRFGVMGVSFLTPVLFSPIGGTLLATAMGSPKSKVIIYMLFSAVFWSITLSKIAQVIV